MKKLLIAASLIASQSAFAVGIASGAANSGTNYPMVQDIVKQCSTTNTPIQNIESNGALENLHLIFGDKRVQYGIVDEVTLMYQQNVDPNMTSRIQTVFPFFSMELHLAVRKNSSFQSLTDLNQYKVYTGAEGSSTAVNAQVLKGLTGVNWQDVNMPQSQAIAALKQNQVAAVFVVAGKGATMFNDPEIRFIPIQHLKLDQFKYYTRTMIPSGTYTGQNAPIQTYKVNNVLATFAFKNQYQKEIGDLVTCIAGNIDKLQANGHPKWREVNPQNIDFVKWPVHPSAMAAIKRIK